MSSDITVERLADAAGVHSVTVAAIAQTLATETLKIPSDEWRRTTIRRGARLSRQRKKP